MTTTGQWIAGARPRTLPAAIVPVAVGTSVAYYVGDSISSAAFTFRAVLALVVSLALQVGVNYANDYSDGIRGTDDRRVGPVRLVGQGLAEPKAVKKAALLAFLVGAIAGLVLVVVTQEWWLIAVGIAAIAAAWFYTGGPKPYGYAGLGEVVVFIFFGLVAVIGTTYVLTDRLVFLAVLLSIPVGLFACALLVMNNLRDIPSDITANKRTLATRLGDPATRRLYGFCLATPFVIAAVVGVVGLGFTSMPPGALFALVPAPLAFLTWKRIARGDTGADLVPVLMATGRLQLVFGLLLALGVVLSK